MPRHSLDEYGLVAGFIGQPDWAHSTANRLEEFHMSATAPDTTVDAIVLGMGPGGETAAERLAAAGLSVIGIDANLVGGECPYYGCIPSKMMIRAANSLAEAGRVADLAGSATVTPSFAPVAKRIRDEATDNWDDQVAVDRFENLGGVFVRGRGRVTGPRTVQVGDQTYTATRAVIINTGTQPAIPPIPGLAGTPYWTNREIVTVTEPPASLIVLGGGAVGGELAQVFARFGTRVDIVEQAPHLLPPKTNPRPGNCSRTCSPATGSASTPAPQRPPCTIRATGSPSTWATGR